MPYCLYSFFFFFATGFWLGGYISSNARIDMLGARCWRWHCAAIAVQCSYKCVTLLEIAYCRSITPWSTYSFCLLSSFLFFTVLFCALSPTTNLLAHDEPAFKMQKQIRICADTKTRRWGISSLLERQQTQQARTKYVFRFAHSWSYLLYYSDSPSKIELKAV